MLESFGLGALMFSPGAAEYASEAHHAMESVRSRRRIQWGLLVPSSSLYVVERGLVFRRG